MVNKVSKNLKRPENLSRDEKNRIEGIYWNNYAQIDSGTINIGKKKKDDPL